MNLLRTTPLDNRLIPVIANQNLVYNIANGVMVQPTEKIGVNKIVNVGKSYAHDICYADVMFSKELDDNSFLERAQLSLSKLLN